MYFERKSHTSFVMCFIFIFINTILVVFAQKKKKKFLFRSLPQPNHGFFPIKKTFLMLIDMKAFILK